MANYDVLIVGAGFSGSVLAERLASQLNKKVLVIDRRDHIGGNSFDYYDEHGVLLHKYGPHYFRTNLDSVAQYLSQFTDWRKCNYRIRICFKGRLFPFPINRNTINQFFNMNLTNSEEVESFLKKKKIAIKNPQNSEEYILSRVGRELYDAFYRNYTLKQWNIPACKLDAAVCARIPIRTTSNDNYFDEKYQMIPSHGYSSMFENMLNHSNITIKLKTKWEEVKDKISYKYLIYTGKIDEFFHFKFGRLPYRSLKFKKENFKEEYFQDWVQINYPNKFDYTRIVETKHITGQKIDCTTIIKEYPSSKGESFYPIPTKENQLLYKNYQNEAFKLKNTFFIGRLAQYEYLNMDQVVKTALKAFNYLKTNLEWE